MGHKRKITTTTTAIYFVENELIGGKTPELGTNMIDTQI